MSVGVAQKELPRTIWALLPRLQGCASFRQVPLPTNTRSGKTVSEWFARHPQGSSRFSMEPRLGKAPNSKHQAPENLQAPTTNPEGHNANGGTPENSFTSVIVLVVAPIGACGLGLLWCLEVGVWCFLAFRPNADCLPRLHRKQRRTCVSVAFGSTATDNVVAIIRKIWSTEARFLLILR